MSTGNHEKFFKVFFSCIITYLAECNSNIFVLVVVVVMVFVVAVMKL